MRAYKADLGHAFNGLQVLQIAQILKIQRTKVTL